MDGKVIQSYQAVYLEALQMTKGDVLQVVRRDNEYPGWVWCTDARGKGGWIPETYLDLASKDAVALQDYTAAELTVQAGDQVDIAYEESGWMWVTDGAGCSGWVPATHIQVISSSR